MARSGYGTMAHGPRRVALELEEIAQMFTTLANCEFSSA